MHICLLILNRSDQVRFTELYISENILLDQHLLSSKNSLSAHISVTASPAVISLGSTILPQTKKCGRSTTNIIPLTAVLANFASDPSDDRTLRDTHCHQENRNQKQNGNHLRKEIHNCTTILKSPWTVAICYF